MATYVLYHVTSLVCWQSIQIDGLRPALATGRRKAVYLTTFQRIPSRIPSILERHPDYQFPLALLQVVRSGVFVHKHGDGIWYTKQVIPAECIIHIGLIDAELRCCIQETPDYGRAQ